MASARSTVFGARLNLIPQLVDFPTHTAPSGKPFCLDWLVTNNPNLVLDIGTDAPLGASDHLQLVFRLDPLLCSDSKAAALNEQFASVAVVDDPCWPCPALPQHPAVTAPLTHVYTTASTIRKYIRKSKSKNRPEWIACPMISSRLYVHQLHFPPPI